MLKNSDREEKIKELKGKLAKYRPIYEEKRRMFRGVRHEDSLSELRYTQFMVYKNMVEGIVKELRGLGVTIKTS